MSERDTHPNRRATAAVRLGAVALVLSTILALAMGPIFSMGAQLAASPKGEHARGLATETPHVEHGMGFVPSDPTRHPIVPVPAQIASITELPTAVDLTESSSMLAGQPSAAGMPPVGYQDLTNTCVGWATSYYYKTYQEWLEHGWALQNGDPNYDHIFSPSFVYNQITGDPPLNPGDPGCDDGAKIGDALELIVTSGDVPMSVFPWYPSDCEIQPDAPQKNAAAAYDGIDYGAFFINQGPPEGPELNNDLTPLKQWLADDDPFVIGFPVYDEFYFYWDSLYTCNAPIGPPGDPTSFHGLHAAAVVGYDDYFGGGAFKIVNSWGTGWGCDGYAWLSYEFVRKYAWEAWWMTSNRRPWIDPQVPDRYSPQVGALIEMDLTPYENDREESGPALKWYVDGENNCTVLAEGSANDVLYFYPKPSNYSGYDEITLILRDSEGAQDSQQVTLGWFDMSPFSYLPLALRQYPD
jgi:hypothetical protein